MAMPISVGSGATLASNLLNGEHLQVISPVSLYPLPAGTNFIGLASVFGTVNVSGNISLASGTEVRSLATILNWPTEGLVSLASGTLIRNEGFSPNGSLASGFPMLVGAQFSGTISLATGAVGYLQQDASGNLKDTMGTLIAGEDLTANVLKVEQRFSYALVTTAATTTIKSGAGFLHTVVIGGISLPTLALYDNTAASGQPIAIFNPNPPVGDHFFDVSFATGLTAIGGAGVPVSVTYTYR
jgi:hypothetical protein